MLTFCRKDPLVELHKLVEVRFLQTIGIGQDLLHQIRMANAQHQHRASRHPKQAIMLQENLVHQLEPFLIVQIQQRIVNAQK